MPRIVTIRDGDTDPVSNTSSVLSIPLPSRDVEIASKLNRRRVCWRGRRSVTGNQWRSAHDGYILSAVDWICSTGTPHDEHISFSIAIYTESHSWHVYSDDSGGLGLLSRDCTFWTNEGTN